MLFAVCMHFSTSFPFFRWIFDCATLFLSCVYPFHSSSTRIESSSRQKLCVRLPYKPSYRLSDRSSLNLATQANRPTNNLGKFKTPLDTTKRRKEKSVPISTYKNSNTQHSQRESAVCLVFFFSLFKCAMHMIYIYCA